MIGIGSIITRCLFIALLCATAGGSGSQTGGNVEPQPQGKSAARPFRVLTLRETESQEFGLVMTCPAHAHGTPQQAMQKLKEILKDRPAGAPSAIWVCRSNLLQTLKEFAPLVDTICLNPFLFTCKNGPKPDDPIWPGLDHPFVNHLREIQANADHKDLLGGIYLTGDPQWFAKRQASFEEVRWMVFALVGAKFKGVIWRDDPAKCPGSGAYDNWRPACRMKAPSWGPLSSSIGPTLRRINLWPHCALTSGCSLSC